MRALGYRSQVLNGKILIEESSSETIKSGSIGELLGFLIEPYEGEDPVKVCWDLADFTAPIFRLLPTKTLEKLVTTKRARVGPYSLFYVPGKVLSLLRGPWKSNIYELKQFYPHVPEPDDANAIAGAAQLLIKDLKKAGLHYRAGDRLTSPVAIIEDIMLKHLDIPTAADVPKGADGCTEYAYACCGRQWVTAYKLGHWGPGETQDWDITAAYPFEASRLYDFRHATSFTYDTEPVEGAHWGFLRGRVTIDCPCSPIMREMGDGAMVNPVGTWDTILTLDEVRFIENNGIGNFAMHDGWFITQKSFGQPLEAITERLYRKRKENRALDLFLKRASAGAFYGKFLEEHEGDEVGRLWNPIYAATIIARTRLKVGQFILDNDLQNDLIHVSVDGLLTTKKLPEPTGAGLGQWKVSEPHGVIVASSGQVFKKGQDHDTRPKGITYNDLVSMIQAHPRMHRYEIVLPRRVTLAEAVRSDNLAALGEVRQYHSSVDFLLQDHYDRQFAKLPKTGENLLTRIYNSEPIEVQNGE